MPTVLLFCCALASWLLLAMGSTNATVCSNTTQTYLMRYSFLALCVTLNLLSTGAVRPLWMFSCSPAILFVTPSPGGGMEGEMAHDKAPIVKRLRTIEGHVRGVERMVDEDAYCIDILMQIDAVQKALDHVSRLVLDGHLHGCVTTAIRSDDAAERERVIGELMHVMHERRK